MADIMAKLQLNDGTSISIGKRQLTQLSATQSSSISDSKIPYGCFSSSGNLNIIDTDTQIANLVKTNQLDSTNVPIELYLNSKKIDTYFSRNSHYIENEESLSVDLSDFVEKLQDITYLGLNLCSIDAYSLLIDVLSAAGIKKQRFLRYDCTGDELFYTNEQWNVYGISLKKDVVWALDNEIAWFVFNDIPDAQYLLVKPETSEVTAFTNGRMETVDIHNSPQEWIEYSGWHRTNINRIRDTYVYYESDDVDKMCSEEIKNRLRNIKIKRAHIEKQNVIEILNKICAIAQIICIKDNDNGLSFIDFDSQVNTKDVIMINSYTQYTPFKSDLFIENNYTGVSVDENNFVDNPGLVQVLAFDINVYDDNNNFILNDPTYNSSVPPSLISSYFGQDSESIMGGIEFNDDVIIDNIKGIPSNINSSFEVETIARYSDNYSVSSKTTVLNGRITNTSEITRTTHRVNVNDFGDVFLMLSPIVLKVSQAHDSVPPFNVRLKTISVSVSLPQVSFSKGTKLTGIRQKTLSISDNELIEKNTLSNGTPVSETLGNALLRFYKNGKRTGTLTISCADYNNMNGSRIVSLDKGEIININDTISLDGNNVWKVTEKTFRYNGVPMIDLSVVQSGLSTRKLKIKNNKQYGYIRIERTKSPSHPQEVGQLFDGDYVFDLDEIKIEIDNNNRPNKYSVTIDNESQGTTTGHYLIAYTVGLGPLEFVIEVMEQAIKFSDADWDDINKISLNGFASQEFNIGDEKTIQLNNRVEVTLVILGFDHDDLTNGGKAGITIGMKDCLPGRYSIFSDMTKTDGGWEKSDMRTKTLPSLLSQLPSDLQKVIKAVDKKAPNGDVFSPTIQVSSDKLWLLCEEEISGTATNSISGQGTQYEYWATIKDGSIAANRIKVEIGHKDPENWAVWYWLRSQHDYLEQMFCAVRRNGDISYEASWNDFCYVSFCFCI